MADNNGGEDGPHDPIQEHDEDPLAAAAAAVPAAVSPAAAAASTEALFAQRLAVIEAEHAAIRERQAALDLSAGLSPGSMHHRQAVELAEVAALISSMQHMLAADQPPPISAFRSVVAQAHRTVRLLMRKIHVAHSHGYRTANLYFDTLVREARNPSKAYVGFDFFEVVGKALTASAELARQQQEERPGQAGGRPSRRCVISNYVVSGSPTLMLVAGACACLCMGVCRWACSMGCCARVCVGCVWLQLLAGCCGACIQYLVVLSVRRALGAGAHAVGHLVLIHANKLDRLCCEVPCM